ncbi:MAG TPA: ABC transporter substrate binding protein, partial [Candidatus Hydrogenedentes bacterium]|nr:ABC transporter substrate binding protein [Candidatus Hydrogenedentota bacterium]
MSAFCCWILAGVALVGADPVLGAELSAAAPSPVMVEDAAPLEGVVLERGRERTAEEIAESYRGFLTPRPPKTVGFVLDGPPAQEDPVDRYAAEIMEVAGKSFDIRFVRRAADQTVAGVDAALHEMLADPGVDLLITTGTLGSFRALRAGAPPKPVIAGMLLEPAVAGLTLSKDGGSGVKNLACAAFEGVVPRDLARFRELAPFTRVAVLVDARLAEAAPNLAANLSGLLGGMDLAVSVVPVGADAAAAVAAIPADAEAVYFAPLPGHTPEGVEALARGVNERRLPSFSLNGPADVRAGVLATLQTENETRRIGRRLANHTYRILSGDAPEILPAAMTAAENFLVNLETARALGLALPWETLVQAETINDEPAQVDARFTLEQAVRTALEANLDLDEKERQVRA